jgi:rod shape determining protein RodA
MSRYLSARDMDWPLLLITLLLCAIGVLQIFSATLDTAFHNAWWRQIVYVGGGLLLMWLIQSIDYHTLLHYVPAFYITSVLALLFTYFLGQAAWGSRRWITLPGGLHLQVSEFVKLVIILLVARYLAELKTEVLEIREMSILSALVLVPAALVLKQPDLGTSLTYGAVLLTGAFLAGLRWKYVIAIGLVAVTMGALVVLSLNSNFLLKDYQKARLVSFMDPERDPQGTGYQLIQSQIAVGHGGMWGKGVTQGTQTQLRFLPVPHQDFIFSAFAEEHGFVGVVFALTLYFVVIMRIVQNAQTAPDPVGMYICMGVAGLMLFHVLVNVGMVTGLMPVTGIPLPFMSAGGSSVWSSFLALGLVNNVRLRRFVN